MENQDETKLEQEQAKESSPLHKQQIEEDEIIKSSEEFERDYPSGPPSISASEQEVRQQEFSDYFNDGYNLAKNDPELYDQVLWEAEDNREQSNALIWGRFMFEQEMQKDEPQSKEAKAFAEIKAIRGRNKEISKEKSVENNRSKAEFETSGFKGFINALKRPGREMAMEKGDSDSDIDRDYDG